MQRRNSSICLDFNRDDSLRNRFYIAAMGQHSASMAGGDPIAASKSAQTHFQNPVTDYAKSGVALRKGGTSPSCGTTVKANNDYDHENHEIRQRRQAPEGLRNLPPQSIYFEQLLFRAVVTSKPWVPTWVPT
jgi:hypothetical protein